jgi:hypothetical protein
MRLMAALSPLKSIKNSIGFIKTQLCNRDTMDSKTKRRFSTICMIRDRIKSLGRIGHHWKLNTRNRLKNALSNLRFGHKTTIREKQYHLGSITLSKKRSKTLQAHTSLKWFRTTHLKRAKDQLRR